MEHSSDCCIVKNIITDCIIKHKEVIAFEKITITLEA